jgi:hypothetical protein
VFGIGKGIEELVYVTLGVGVLLLLLHSVPIGGGAVGRRVCCRQVVMLSTRKRRGARSH